LLKKKGLIDSQLTEQAVNTCFNEVKFKNDLQINYEQFLDLVQFIARVKYPHLSYEASFGVFEHDLTLTIGEKKYAVSAEKKTAIIPKKMIIKLSKHTKKTSPRKMSLNA
jgi:Ca2+-binding EF-hand superfamily protein